MTVPSIVTDHLSLRSNVNLDAIQFDIAISGHRGDQELSVRLLQITTVLKSHPSPPALSNLIIAIRVGGRDMDAVTSALSVHQWSEVADTLGPSFQNLTSLKVKIISYPVTFETEDISVHITRAFAGLGPWDGSPNFMEFTKLS